MRHSARDNAAVFAKADDEGSANPDPTMRNLPGKPGAENVPPAGGESMAPADSKQPFAKPDDKAAQRDTDA